MQDALYSIQLHNRVRRRIDFVFVMMMMIFRVDVVAMVVVVCGGGDGVWQCGMMGVCALVV